jgi:protein transport protein SEC23
MILDDLQKDPWPRQAQHRPMRSSGVALNVASCLLELTSAYNGSRIMMFVGGPPTEGTGRICALPNTEFMRQHVDIEKGNTPYLKDSLAFYKGIAERCVKNNHAVDLFAMSLDQVGLMEMQSCIQSTGGLCVLGDSFGQSVFKESFRRVFKKCADDSPDAGQLTMGFSANLEVLTTREFKICGAIGPCSSLKKKSPNVGEVEVGEGGTCAWSMGSIFPTSTIGVYFEVVNPPTNPLPVGQRWHLQFVTNYQHANGAYRIRVTTVSGAWHNDEKNKLPVQMSFDQEAAAVLVARIASLETETKPRDDVLRWVDRCLIRLARKFADYRENDASSFQLSAEFRIFPQFMFHLRRSQFLNYFNCSPDESTNYRLLLRRENTTNSLVMIQPALLSYSFHGPPQPVLLDAASVASDTILLLDTFFHVVVFHGTTIAMWRAAGYQDQADHIHFKNLLLAPRNDAQMIMEERFPVPRYILCDEGKSESRFLMAKLNPSVTHQNRDGAHAPIFTEDVSLRIFMEHLMKLAVAPE